MSLFLNTDFYKNWTETLNWNRKSLPEKKGELTLGGNRKNFHQLEDLIYETRIFAKLDDLGCFKLDQTWVQFQINWKKTGKS